MNISEDELEQRLRALFADERLDLPPPPDAGTVIVAGARRRRRRRQGALTVVGVAAAVVAVAGGLTVVRLHTEEGTAVISAGGSSISVKPPENLTPGRSPQPSIAAPTSTNDIEASSPPASAPSRTARPSSAQPPSKLAPVSTGPLLASDGFGNIKLGMSEAQVNAQGVTLSDAQVGGSCTTYTVKGSGVPATATVVISKAVGLTVVTPAQTAHTVEGVGAGSTKDQVLAAYPEAKDEPGGIVAPALSTSAYHFRLDDTGVVQTSLMSLNQDCAG
ncbi:hypothetical protein VA596_10615 [Amycolatopsis sp., V23-08]|uniref:Uncharacterized protein n=1 Tax=Amycolatopsis heterodermiae TaxID=3110235 RepID=A0ABU5R2U8_9PSEU|nr:hypothetical protein [Amycolatopsis sp., V23-08]MEA5359989.1 hypothetical protein [Amycolatopsis sp., V23-08]